MEKNKTLTIAEKVKACAMTLIGTGIFSQGTLYFKEQSNYNIPRILYPVYTTLGNKGLAVAMVILGLVLIYFGFTKWKNHGGKVITLGAITGFFLVLFFSILLLTGNKKTTSDDLIKASDERQSKGIEDMKAMEKPDFGDAAYDKLFDDFEVLLAKYKDANQNKDEKAVALLQKDFEAWGQQANILMQKLKTIPEKQQFSLYTGKLVMQWRDINP